MLLRWVILPYWIIRFLYRNIRTVQFVGNLKYVKFKISLGCFLTEF
uniref:Uncharacterized protein n=1 Tax=Triticum urartu TaxID=4572 RepID=A0A8R7UXL9_TRIUA